MTFTLCNECDHVHAESRKRIPTQWLCIKFPRLTGTGFVSPHIWTEAEPYMRCAGINGGKCPMWAPIRNGQRDNGL